MPPTASLQARYDEARRALDNALSTDAAERQIEQAQRDARWAHRRLNDGLARDAIAASRPEGCWCLGLGGKDVVLGASGLRNYKTYCPCPDGELLREKHADENRIVEEDRVRRRIERMTQEAGIPYRFYGYSFSSYPDNEQTAATVQHLRDWAKPPADGEEPDGYWENRKGSIYLWGGFGTGKTGLAVAALRLWIQAFQEQGRFITTSDLLETIRRSYDKDSDARDEVDRIRDYPLLVLDDIGAERVTDWAAERLFALINHRHDYERDTIFTSNLSPNDLAAHIGPRSVWRIVEMAEIVHIDGPNLRDTKAQS